MPTRPEDLVDNPRGLYSLVFLLVAGLALKLGEPVLHETLQWYSDVVDATKAPEPLNLLREELGPRPRRSQLVITLGDLVDLGLLDQEPRGFNVTDTGWKTFGRLNEAGTPDFEPLLATVS